MAKRGQPKRFETGDELIALWCEFCNDIVANEFKTVPTQSAFCRWLAQKYTATDRRTIYNALNEYFPNIKKDFEQLQSDTIMQGGMLGKYNATMSIFGLKNWCGWSDSGSTNNKTDEPIVEDALTKALKEEAERMQNADIE
jgi:hypothetical protein